MVSGFRKAIPLAFGWLLLGTPAPAQTAADSSAIRAAALDYIEGWYEGDAERMKRAVHPDLAKRIVFRFLDGDEITETDAKTLIKQTERGGGSGTPEEERRTDVRILDIFEGAASVRVDAAAWIDYMHLAVVDGRWVIMNVLWETRPR
jgi:hypothetical protein